MYGSGRVAVSDVQEALPNVQEWSGGPPECLGVVGTGQDTSGALQVIAKRLQCLATHSRTQLPPGHPGGTPDHSRTYGRASRLLADIREGFPTSPVHPGEPPDHSRTSRRGSQPLLDIREGLSTTPGHPGGPPDHSRTSGTAFRPLPDILEGLPTTPGHSGGPPDNYQTYWRASEHSRTSGRAY